MLRKRDGGTNKDVPESIPTVAKPNAWRIKYVVEMSMYR